MTEPLYKVCRVQDGVARPCHGGSVSFTWPLPTVDGPAEWVEVEGPIALCERGLHLTREPIAWWINDPDVRLFEAEHDGELIDGGEKVCVKRARLLREVDWAVAQVFRDGEHVVKSGRAFAYGSATVRAYGSATVRAYDSATVEAYDSATVEAYGSATVISTHWHVDTAEVALSQMAAHVDRRNGKVAVRTASEVPA